MLTQSGAEGKIRHRNLPFFAMPPILCLNGLQSSTRHEIRVAAHFKEKNFSGDEKYEIEIVVGGDMGSSPAKKADTVCKQAHIQSAESGTTVSNKLRDDSSGIAEAIKQARDLNKQFIIAHSDAHFTISYENNIEKARDLNLALAELYNISLADAIKDGPASGIFDALPASVRFPNATAFAYYVPVE